MISAIISLFTWLWGLVTKGRSVDKAQTQAVEASNQIGKQTADVSRDTQRQIDEGLSDEDQDAMADRSRLDSADSLRDQRDVVADAIARANSRPGADG